MVDALSQGVDFSVLVATVFHIAINFINLLILDVMYQPTFWVLNGSVWAVVAAIFVLKNRGLFLGVRE